MIYEYTLEPSLLTKWADSSRDYSEFLREYGIGTSRLFSSFPKRKASKLRSYLLKAGPQDDQSLHGRRYTEMVNKLVECLVFRETPNYQSTNWTDIVTIENERLPFGVILSSQSLETEKNITPDNMYSATSIWNCVNQLNIQRTNPGLMTAFNDLVRLATEQIVVVDTFGWTTEAISFMRHLINSIPTNRVNQKLPLLTLFYKEKRGGKTGGGSPSADHVKTQIMQEVSAELSDIELQVIELKEIDGNDVFHNRCLLTELGGVITGHGIGVSGEEHHSDEAILMAADIYQKKWAQFVEELNFGIVSESQ
ncbi:hypothetical protein [Paraglaciecola sp.]|uniref:hypothetical protein n=1 Tax=Paraglaciecola sp. TaxID=1920173 RepID=UPI0032640D0C